MAKFTVPEIWFKTQRVIRTVIQVIITAAVTIVSTIAVIQLIAPQILEALAEVLPPSWIAWLSGAVAFMAVLAGALSKIMAIPQVNAWLTKFGAGSVPKSVAEATTAE